MLAICLQTARFYRSITCLKKKPLAVCGNRRLRKGHAATCAITNNNQG
jgi:hypothetical protein